MTYTDSPSTEYTLWDLTVDTLLGLTGMSLAYAGTVVLFCL